MCQCACTSEQTQSLCAMRNILRIDDLRLLPFVESEDKKSSLSIQRWWNGDAETAVAKKKEQEGDRE
jgi:hypothetical protein